MINLKKSLNTGTFDKTLIVDKLELCPATLVSFMGFCQWLTLHLAT